MTSQVTLNEQVADELRVAAARRKVTTTDLARTIGVDRVWVWRRLNAHVAMSIDDLAQICEALDVSPADLLMTAMRRPEPVAAATAP